MPEHMYRFRPVERLLGKNGEEGELAGQYIYFASPDQLNDPLEGYKDVYFNGDQIIWKNLIKHYVRCLINSCFDFVLSDKNVPPAKKVNVFASATEATEPLNKLNQLIFKKLTSEPCIDNYLSKISLNRKVRRWELLAYIQTLHFYVLDIIFESFYTERILTTPLRPIIEDRAEALSLIESISSGITNTPYLTEEEEKDFLTSYQRNSERQLLTRYRTDGKSREGLFFLIFEYAETFCRDIESLMYPRWYTACFMSLASCSDSSIWGSYGGNHKDVCLKFHTEKHYDRDALKLIEPSDEDERSTTRGPTLFAFHNISYEKPFIEIDFFRSLGHLPAPMLSRTWLTGENGERSKCAELMDTDVDTWRSTYWDNFYHCITVKLKVWDREKESRLILTSMMRDLSNDKHRKLTYEFNSLEGIIFGINTTMENKIKTIKTIENLCIKYKRQEFSFYQARYDERSREIVHDKLDLIHVGYSEQSE